MAFRLPSQVQQRRPSFQNAVRPAPPAINIPRSNYGPREEESQEWVLFSPELALSATDRTHTTSTEQTPRTAGRSRLSDFGSLGTALQSGTEAVDLDHEHDDLLDDATELDSLDDGLHAFREPTPYTPSAVDQFQLHHSDPALLPAHDGLGTFPSSNRHIQEQLWQHEQFNPRRRGELRPRRRSSVQRHLDIIDEMENRNLERERWQRIEEWRMEQSRALLQGIEKETKRRRYSRASHSTLGSAGRTSSAARSMKGTKPVMTENTHSTAPGEKHQNDSEDEESFWRRITRKVIRDLIGIDDGILAVIFGNAFTEGAQEERQENESNAAAPTSGIRIDTERPKDLDEMLKSINSPSSGDDAWQQRFLDRIARELGILVHQIYDHPGAFTTYLSGGSPASSDHADTSTVKSSAFSHGRHIPSRTVSSDSAKTSNPNFAPVFAPTLKDPVASSHDALWGIEEENPLSANDLQASHRQGLEHDPEYWERDLDMKMVFRYLCKGFAGKTPLPNDGTRTPTPSTHREQEQQDASRRASILRHQHPLVARADAHARSHRPPPRHWQTSSSGTGLRANKVNSHSTSSTRMANSSSAPLIFRHIRRPGSSCASQSTRMSSPKGPLASGSSRHYWDIGGSVGSGSAIAAGGMGSWGDV